MNSLDKLLVVGIRSFNPNPGDAEMRGHVIKFFSPLTVILGPNGSGKTTIIECLRNACTGDFPSTEKASFVHDPQLCNRPEVQGLIKLQFTRENKEYTVSRSYQVTQKAVASTKSGSSDLRYKTTFKSLQSSLQVKSADGERQSTTTNRCQDMDRLIPSLMGTSPAILANVIFCLQDETFWPLEDSRKLKERFDEIFSATRYAKALDNLKKLKSAKKKDVQRASEETNILSVHRKNAIAIGEKKEKCVNKLRECVEQINALDEKIRSASELYRKIEANAEQRRELDDRIARSKQQIEMYKSQVSGALESLHSELPDRDERLEQFLAQLPAKLQQKKMEIDQCERNIGRLRTELREFQIRVEQDTRREASASAKSSTLCTEFVQQYKSDICKQICESETFGEVQDKYSSSSLHQTRAQIVGFAIGDPEDVGVSTVTDVYRAVNELHSALSGMCDSEVDSLQNVKKRCQSEISSQQKLVNELTVEKQTLQRRMDEKRREVTAIQRVLQEKSSDVSDITEDMLKKAQARMERLQSEYESRSSVEEERKVESSVKAAEHELETIRAKMEDLETRLQERESLRNEYVRVETWKTEYATRLSGIEEWFDDNEVELHKYLSLPSTYTSKELVGDSKLLANYEKELNSLRVRVGDMKQKLAAATQRKHQLLKEVEDCNSKKRQRLNECKVEDMRIQTTLRSVKDSLTEEDSSAWSEGGDDEGNVDLTGFISTLEAKLLHVRRQCSETRAMRECYEHFLSHAEESAECLVCERALNSDEMEDFRTRQQSRVADAPDEISALQARDSSLQSSVDECRRLVPVQMEVRRKRGREIPDLEASMGEKQSALQKAEDEITRLSSVLSEQEKRLNMMQQFLSEVREICSECSICISLDAKIREAEVALGGGDQGEYTALKDEQKALQSTKDEWTLKLKEGQETVRNHREELAELSSKCRDSREKFQSLQARMNEAHVLVQEREKADKLQAEIVDLESRLRSSVSSKLRQEENVLGEMEEKNAQAISALEKSLSGLQSLVSISSRSLATMQRIRKELPSLLEESKKCGAQVAKRKREMGEKQSEIERIEGQLDNLRKLVAERDSYRRNVEDNLKYRTLKQTLKAEEATLLSLVDQKSELLGDGVDMDVDELMDADLYRRTRAELGEAQRQRSFLEGTQKSIQREIEDHNVELQGSTYKDIHRRYHEKEAELRTFEMAMQDLDTFHKALDRALVKYHAMKMEEVNTLLRDLWQKVYRGNDIDTIEIRSETDAATTASDRGSFKYRVVMLKGRVPLDMRGRSSMGQRVLASLVIRLALAEAFCIECGVLALDEPTTNLDQENIDALADALKTIIADRRRQKNFQLIIITHDEDFVAKLGQTEYLESYYRVYKDELTQHSVIAKQSLRHF